MRVRRHACSRAVCINDVDIERVEATTFLGVVGGIDIILCRARPCIID